MGPDKAQMERFLTVVEEGRPVKKRALRTGLVAALVCVLLVGTAFAASPALRDVIDRLLGSFAPYTQEVEGVSATDQGIQIRVAETIADQWNAKIYLEVTDQTGDRLDEALKLSGDISNRVISYDAETKTALVEVNAGYGVHTMGRDTVLQDPETIQIDGIHAGLTAFSGVVLPQDKLTDKTLKTRVVNDGGEWTVLEPNQTPAKLNTDLFSLSSVGFDGEGRLHIQLKLADGVETTEHWNFFPEADTWTETGPDGSYWLEFSQIEEFEDGKYVDWVMGNVSPEDLSSFRLGALKGEVWTKPAVEGSWTLTFPLTKLPGRTVTMSEHFVGPMTLTELTVTTLQVRDRGTTLDGQGCLTNFPPTVYFSDGTTAQPRSDGGSWNGSGAGQGAGVFHDTWYFEDPIDPDRVVGISYGLWYIPIDGETGGPGYWLSELPK